MRWLFASGSQSTGASASVLPMNIQDWFPLGLTALISLLSMGLLRVFSNTTVQKHLFFDAQPSLWSSFHMHTWLLEKPGIPISVRIFQFVVIHTVKGFSIINEAEVDVFLEFPWFSKIQQMLAIWSLVPLPFLKPAWTCGSSQFTYCWSLAWKILSIILLACEMSAFVW